MKVKYSVGVAALAGVIMTPCVAYAASTTAPRSNATGTASADVVLPQPVGRLHGSPIPPYRPEAGRPGAATVGAAVTAAQLRHAYGLDRLPRREQGVGATVAVVLPYRDPVLRHDLKVFSARNGLPRPRLRVITESGVPVADPSIPGQAIAAQEGELDAQMIHTAAPRARIVYVQVRPQALADPARFGEVFRVLSRVAKHVHIDVASFSYGFFEANFAERAGSRAGGAALLRRQRHGLVHLSRHGVTLVAADGDTGPTGPNLAGTAVYGHPTVAWPASDPLVTAVSGTRMHLDAAGNRTAPDTAWADAGDGAATGGGVSDVFTRPRYQHGVAPVVGHGRGIGDIAMNGASASRILMYSSHYQALPGQKPGWVAVAGTSESAPLFAGVAADAAGLIGHRLGAINPALYTMAAHPATRARAGIADVTSGCITDYGITGPCATAGGHRTSYDLASGIGTIRTAPRFIAALAMRAALHHHRRN